MALTATINTSTTPPTLTVQSDRRKVKGTITSAGDTATYEAQFPVTIADDTGRVWTAVSDDGVTAVFTS